VIATRSRSNAGHAGHMLVGEENDMLCGCGNRGDVEGMISGRNLGQSEERAASAASSAAIATSAPSAASPLTAPLLFQAARAGNPQALSEIRHAARVFGRALYNLAITLDTRVFVIGGSIWSHHGDFLLPMVENEITSRLPALTRGVTIKTALMGELVVDIGALGLVMPTQWVAKWRRTQPWLRLATRN